MGAASLRCPWRDHARVLREAPARSRVPAGTTLEAVLPVRGRIDGEVLARGNDRLREIAGLDAQLRQERAGSAGVVVRFPPGRCPIDVIERALSPLGLGVEAERCVQCATSPSVELRISAPRHQHKARGGTLDNLGAIARGALRSREVMLVLAGGVLVLLSTIVHAMDGPAWARIALCVVSAILTSRSTFPDLVETLRRFRLNIDVLMFGAALGASALGHYEEGALLLFLFGLGSAGEHAAMTRAKDEIESLGRLAPDAAEVVLDDGSIRTTPIEGVPVGATIAVRPFDRIPLDGEIIEGKTAIDESTLTGEPIPVDKGVGARVFAGTMNTHAAVRVRVTHGAGETTIDRIIHLVSEARESRSRAHALVERVERVLVPTLLALTLALIVLPPMLTDVPWSIAFYRAMAFMTAGSPCALAIGVPAATLCGIARGARGGVLIKGGAVLDALASVRAIAIDKTGTITIGRPDVGDVVAREGEDAGRVLALAAAVERDATHPIARAIVEHADRAGIDAPRAEGVRQVAGVGAEGMVDAVRIGVVKPAAVRDELWTPGLRGAMDEGASRGATLVAVTQDDRLIGVITLSDAIQDGAKDSIARLRTLGFSRIAMLTGDHEASARAVAHEVGIDEVHAALTPEDKMRLVAEMDEREGGVVMVGDGVNDALALARARVGIAMGAAGAGVALETADAALMGSRVSALPDALELARRTRSIIRQNLTIALVVIAVVAPMGAMGYASLGLAVLLHEGSTVVVAGNAMRLLGRRVR